MSAHRPAKDVQVGDHLYMTTLDGKPAERVTVVAVEPTVQVIQRKMMTVTVRARDGRNYQRRFGELFTLRYAEGDLRP